MENKKPAPSAVPDKFDDPDFNPFETKSKLENKQPAPSVVPDKFDDPNFNPFETKSKVAIDSTEKLEDTSPVQLDKTKTKKGIYELSDFST